MSQAFKALNRQVMDGISTDSEALKMLTNRDGITFKAWAAKHEAERRAYAEAIRVGYPPAHVARASSQKWESMLAYCQEQAAVARAFKKRALAVSRALLAKRGVRATEAESEARTWEQDEEVERWQALVFTIQEWLWEARGSEKALQAVGALHSQKD